MSEDATIARIDRNSSPGRQVRVSAICIGMGGDRDAKLKLAEQHLHEAGRNGVDIALLPEEFAGTNPEPIPGPLTDAVGRLAREYNMYVICPIAENAGKRRYNTAVLIGRNGEVIDRYRKYCVYWGEGWQCGEDGAKAFDLDFGRIAILTCFDANFAELWFECCEKDAEAVFWPSAYGGGMVLNAYAMLHNYYIVPAGEGNIIGITGETVSPVRRVLERQFIATLDLDRTIVHQNFTGGAVQQLLAEHKDEVEIERTFDMEAWWLLRAVKPGVRVRDLCRQYGIETLREYRRHSRSLLNELRAEGRGVDECRYRERYLSARKES